MSRRPEEAPGQTCLEQAACRLVLIAEGRAHEGRAAEERGWSSASADTGASPPKDETSTTERDIYVNILGRVDTP